LRCLFDQDLAWLHKREMSVASDLSTDRREQLI
jgi:hypothetical protein